MTPNANPDHDTPGSDDPPSLFDHFPPDEAGTLTRLLEDVIETLGDRPGLTLHSIPQPTLETETETEAAGPGPTSTLPRVTITISGDDPPTGPTGTLEHRVLETITEFAAADPDGWLPGHVSRETPFLGQFIGGAVVIAARELDLPIRDSEVAAAVQHASTVVFPGEDWSDATPLTTASIMKMKRKYDEVAGEWRPPVAAEHFITRYGHALHLHPDTVAAARRHADDITTTNDTGVCAGAAILAGMHETGEPRPVSSVERVTSLDNQRMNKHVPDAARDADRPRVALYREPRPAANAGTRLFDSRDAFITIPRVVADWLDLDGLVVEWHVDAGRENGVQPGAERENASSVTGGRIYQSDPGRVLLTLSPVGDVEDVIGADAGDVGDADGDADALMSFCTPANPLFERAESVDDDVIRLTIPPELTDVFPDEFLWDWDWDWDADDPRTSRASRLLLREVPE